MHILLIHQAFAAIDEPGGTRHHEMARQLVAMGHRVTVVTGTISYMTGTSGQRRPGRSTDEVGVEIIRCRAYGGWHASFPARVLSFVTFMASSTWTAFFVPEVDVVWITSPPIFQAASGWVVARLRRAGLLLEIRDLWPEFAVAVGVLRQPILIRLSLWLEGFLYRHAGQIVVNSPGFVEHVAARGGREIQVIPNGVDPAMFHPEDRGEAFRKEHGLVGKFVVLYAGAHGMSNDLGVLLEVAERLVDRPEIAFVLLGDGKEKPILQMNAAARGLKNVTFLPPMAKTEMSQALAASDVGVAMLKPIAAYKTTYPNKVFDYMAAGRPVLLAIDGVIRALVEKAHAGLYVEPGDAQALAQAIGELAADVQRAHELGDNGRRLVEGRFTRRQTAEQLAGALRKALPS